LRETIQTIPKNGLCFFKGIETLHRNWEDVDYKVDQDSNFWYLFGVNLPDFYAIIDIESGKTTLFAPKID
jgi:Xaa-Pro dipeptidase